MRIIADENIPMEVIRRLRSVGHDVRSVKETMRSAADPSILERAQIEERLVITSDKDFGELAFRFGLPAHCGVVLFRLSGPSRASDIDRMVGVLTEPRAWEGHFSVVEDDRIRIRLLPT